MRRRIFLVVCGFYGDKILRHDISDHCIPIRKHQRLSGYDSDKLSVLRDVAGVDCFLIHALRADLVERFTDRHIPPQTDIFRRHDAAGAVLGIQQNLIDDPPRLHIRAFQNARHDIGRHLLDNIDRIVEIQLIDNLFQLLVAETCDQHFLCVALHCDKNLRRLLLGQQPEADRHLFFGKSVERFRYIDRIFMQKELFQSFEFLCRKKLFNFLVKLICIRHNHRLPLPL